MKTALLSALRKVRIDIEPASGGGACLSMNGVSCGWHNSRHDTIRLAARMVGATLQTKCSRYSLASASVTCRHRSASNAVSVPDVSSEAEMGTGSVPSAVTATASTGV